jgi:pyruvate dehydrogenase E2 component (dihydrolipoamide acetyltransferase)
MVRDQSAISAFANFKASDAPAAAGAKAPAAAPPSQPAPPPPPPPPKPTASPAPQSVTPQSSGGRVFATPLAKKLAAERNIDLSVCFFFVNFN